MGSYSKKTQSNTRKILLISIICLAIVGLIVALRASQSKKPESSQAATKPGNTELRTLSTEEMIASEAENTEPEEETTSAASTETTGSAATTAAGNHGGGETPKDDPSRETTRAPEETQSSQTPSTEANSAKKEITYEQYSLFSGQYVEDGTDEQVKNVAAILVTNQSDQYLDLATLAFDIDGKAATFLVAGLPAGRSAWVMEATRMTATNDSVFSYLDSITSFRKDTVASTDKITLQANGTSLTATNNTDAAIEDVFVCYRTLHTDGNFFGGICYRVDFGTLAPGASVEKTAGHYSEQTEIVRIGWR